MKKILIVAAVALLAMLSFGSLVQAEEIGTGEILLYEQQDEEYIETYTFNAREDVYIEYFVAPWYVWFGDNLRVEIFQPYVIGGGGGLIATVYFGEHCENIRPDEVCWEQAAMWDQTNDQTGKQVDSGTYTVRVRDVYDPSDEVTELYIAIDLEIVLDGQSGHNGPNGCENGSPNNQNPNC